MGKSWSSVALAEAEEFPEGEVAALARLGVLEYLLARCLMCLRRLFSVLHYD